MRAARRRGMPTHAFEQHTGEVKVRIDAESLAELYAEAARALSDLLGRPSGDAAGPWQQVTVTARDRESLLVAWLNELVARTEIDQRLYCDVSIDSITATALTARIRGAPFGETRTAVKAATLHGLRVEVGPDRASATVILDV